MLPSPSRTPVANVRNGDSYSEGRGHAPESCLRRPDNFLSIVSPPVQLSESRECRNAADASGDQKGGRLRCRAPWAGPGPSPNEPLVLGGVYPRAAATTRSNF